MKIQGFVQASQSNKRLDLILKDICPQFSRARLQKIIKDGCCLIDGCPQLQVDYKPIVGQLIEIEITDVQNCLNPEKEELSIIWHDENLAVCDKPPDLTVHPCPSCQSGTLTHRLLSYFPELSKIEGERPGIVHRLDKDTSGLIVIALNEETRLKLSEAFSKRQVSKHYLAIVAGVAPESGECREPIGRHPILKTRMAVLPVARGGREAHTTWRRLWHNERISLLNVRIYTGRTHQIRVHLSAIGYPILGDAVYAPESIRNMAPRQMLHAWQLTFKHPYTEREMKFVATPPDDFLQALINNCDKISRVVVTGNPGCGKSTFCQKLREQGIPVISADDIVSDIYKRSGFIGDWIRLHTGQDIYDDKNSLDKSVLFTILASDIHLKRDFESFIHSEVLERVKEFWRENESCGQLISVAEIPLYFECGWQNVFKIKPLTVGIYCVKNERWSRIKKTRGWSEDKFATLDSWQLPEERKIGICDFVYDNSEPGHDLSADAVDLIKVIKERNAENQSNILDKLRKLCQFPA